LLNQINQIQPKSERLNATLVSWQTLTGNRENLKGLLNDSGIQQPVIMI